MRTAWTAFKLLLCAALVILAGVVTFASLRQADHKYLFMAAFLLILAGSLWVKYPTVRTWFVCGAFGASLFFVAYRVLTGVTSLPRQCGGRGSPVCHLENVLFEIAGRPGAASFWMVCGAAFVYVAYRLTKSKAPEIKLW